MDKIVAVSLNDMTYGELEMMEEVLGMIPEDDTALNALPKSKVLIALGWISGRRVNPDLTLQEVRDMPMGTIVIESEEEDPTKPSETEDES